MTGGKKRLVSPGRLFFVVGKRKSPQLWGIPIATGFQHLEYIRLAILAFDGDISPVSQASNAEADCAKANL